MEKSDDAPLAQDSIVFSKDQITARGPLALVAAVTMLGFGSLAALPHSVDPISGWRLALSACVAAYITLPVLVALALLVYLIMR